MKIDQSKRTALKSIGLTGLGVGAAVTVPGVLVAAQSGLAEISEAPSIPFSGVELVHYSNFQGHTVLLRNTTDRTVTLHKLSPRQIATPDGSIDLGVLLESGELSIPANTTQALSISGSGKAERHASWVHLGGGRPVTLPDAEIQSVTVSGKYDGMREISASRLHTAAVSVS